MFARPTPFILMLLSVCSGYIICGSGFSSVKGFYLMVSCLIFLFYKLILMYLMIGALPVKPHSRIEKSSVPFV